MDWSRTEGGQRSVEPAHEHFDVVANLLVLRNVLPGRNGYLHEDGRRGIQALVLQDLCERLQADVDSLGVVQPINTEQNRRRRTHLRTQLSGPLEDVGRRCSCGETLGVDTDRKGADTDAPVIDAHGSFVGRDAQRTLTRIDELPRIVVCVKSDEIGPEQPLENLSPPGQLGEQCTGREGNVQEEADAEIRTHFSQHAGDELQLIVVHPHGRVGLRDLRDARGKGVIDSLVGAELVSVIHRRHYGVVIKRPDR